MLDDVYSGGRDSMTDQFPGFVIGRSITPSPLPPKTSGGGKQGFSCKLGNTALHERHIPSSAADSAGRVTGSYGSAPSHNCLDLK
jgi:hypothetical protein